MLDLSDNLLSPPARPFMSVARGLLYLGWDLCVQTVGWTLGWPLCRLLTLGYFPAAAFRDLEHTHGLIALLVELVGLAALALLVMTLLHFS